ncbi:MAG: flavodoxin [bacterium]|nr:flavodoxin [bacterium]
MNKKLVAYFSATGVTEGVAKKLANVTEGDLFEIKPQTPYTSADLDWNNKDSRSSVEMSDPSSRPAIATKVDNMDEYDTVFIGFPVWWYVAPTIINTFLESYDFAGKNIVLFATSGSSQLGDTMKVLMPCVDASAKWVSGKRFSSDVSAEELADWVKSLGL